VLCCIWWNVPTCEHARQGLQDGSEPSWDAYEERSRRQDRDQSRSTKIDAVDPLQQLKGAARSAQGAPPRKNAAADVRGVTGKGREGSACRAWVEVIGEAPVSAKAKGAAKGRALGAANDNPLDRWRSMMLSGNRFPLFRIMR